MDMKFLKQMRKDEQESGSKNSQIQSDGKAPDDGAKGSAQSGKTYAEIAENRECELGTGR